MSEGERRCAPEPDDTGMTVVYEAQLVGRRRRGEQARGVSTQEEAREESPEHRAFRSRIPGPAEGAVPEPAMLQGAQSAPPALEDKHK